MGNNKEKVIEDLQNYNSEEKIKRQLELSKAKSEAENRYLGVTGKQIEFYQKVLGYLLFTNPLKKLQNPTFKSSNSRLTSQTNTSNEISNEANTGPFAVSKLWKYGISGDFPILLVKIKEVEVMKVT